MRGYESVLPVDVVDQKRSKAVLPEVAIYRKSSGFGRSIATFFVRCECRKRSGF